jgi:hypothetical protein
MDKSWIMKPRGSDAYEQGVIEFIKFAFKDEKENSEIICPCELCRFKNRKVGAECPTIYHGHHFQRDIKRKLNSMTKK